MYSHLASLLVALVHYAFDPLPYPDDLTQWVEIPVPKEGTDERRRFFRAANNSSYSWVVSVSGKRVVARLAEQSRAEGTMPDFPLDVEDVPESYRRPFCAARVEDGWLVSYNKGEFGGAVWWFSADGKKRYEVESGNVWQFVATKDGIFAVDGLAHLTMNYGSIVRITKKDGRWVGNTFAKLPAEGCAAVALADGTLVVGTASRFAEWGRSFDIRTAIVRVTKEGKV